MINQYEVPAYLLDEIPEIEEQLKTTSNTINIFKALQCLVLFTKEKIEQHDFDSVKKTFAVAEKVYTKGNERVRNAVENVFVFSFSSLMNLCDKTERKQLQAIMPLDLHTAYVQQVLRS